MSLIDLFKEFHRDAIQQEFPTSARVLYDTLLYKFNEAYWTDELAFSERDLIQLTGLPKTTLNRAKHFLASRHFIKITPFKNKTAFTLCNGPVTDQSRTGSGPVADHPEEFPIIRARKDVKTFLSSSLSSTRTRARINRELETAADYWSDTVHGGKLTFEHLSELQNVVERHDVDWLIAAMKEASDANGSRFGTSPKLLFAVIERLENPRPQAELKIVKGGGKRERPATSEHRYDLAGTDSVPEWADVRGVSAGASGVH